MSSRWAFAGRHLPGAELLGKMGESLVQPGILGAAMPDQHMLVVADHVLKFVDEGARQLGGSLVLRHPAPRVVYIANQPVEDFAVIGSAIVGPGWQQVR